ncbi:MAG: hypothetical protein JWP14_2944 [Frankiales bacterium]|jgi:hypothetical protein|nr:hypothetical protein [Frankiales bacterium]
MTTKELRRLTVAGMVALTVLVLYWALWYVAREAVRSDDSHAYYDFENAFPLADAWLGLCVLLAVRAVRRGSPTALLWLLTGGGAGVYLFCMDVLYDLEHGIYATGAGGVIELGINLLTLGMSAWFLRWAWSRRDVLLSSPG